MSRLLAAALARRTTTPRKKAASPPPRALTPPLTPPAAEPRARTPPRGAVCAVEGLYERRTYAVTCARVLRAGEAAALVAAAEARGFVPAPLNAEWTDGLSLRLSASRDMCVVDDDALAAKLFRRVRHLFPPTDDGRVLVGLSERFRFHRYREGHFFRQHRDAPFRRTSGPRAGEASRATLTIYLTADYQGGRTTLYGVGTIAAVEPAVGLALAHAHDLTREEPAVVAGVKYVLRTDAMYADPTRGPAG